MIWSWKTACKIAHAIPDMICRKYRDSKTTELIFLLRHTFNHDVTMRPSIAAAEMLPDRSVILSRFRLDRLDQEKMVDQCGAS